MYTLRIEYCLESWDRPLGYPDMPTDRAIEEAARFLEQSTFARIAAKAILFNANGSVVKQWTVETKVR